MYEKKQCQHTLLALLCKKCWIDFPTLAVRAGVERADVTSVVFSLPVSPAIAKSVLSAYTALAQTGETYTMRNVEVNLIEHTIRPIIFLQMPFAPMSDLLQHTIAVQTQTEGETLKENTFSFVPPSGSSAEKMDALLNQLDFWYLTDQKMWPEHIVCIQNVEEDIPWAILRQISCWCQTYINGVPLVFLIDGDEIVGALSL